jgi:hypothetical protein
MKTVLAVIVNFGSEQKKYLQQVVTALKEITAYKITVIVNSNIPLPDITGIDQVNVIELYTKWDITNLLFKIDKRLWNGKVFDYKLLPMTCRQVIDQETENYDYFIFTENDHLWLEDHISSFIEYERILPENRIAGLIQYEVFSDASGFYYPAYHANYDWDFDSVEEYSGKKFAHFTNLNQSCFIISKEQLKRIKMMHGNFVRFYGKDRYRTIPKVNTDIYQHCGMKKVICISEFQRNLIHHVPNIYTTGKLGRDKLGSGDDRMKESLQRLLQTK